MAHGFVYLTANDWASRYVLSWEVSLTMDDNSCVNALKSALRKHKTTEIFNTDQGAQYTGKAFTGVLKDRMHHHTDCEEWWYFVEGFWEWNIDGLKKSIFQGEIVFIERNRKYQVIVSGEKMLFVW